MSNTTNRATNSTVHGTPLPHENDELLTLKEVAAIIRVPDATLRYWRHLGAGPHSFRIGRSVRYWRTDVLAWLEAKTNTQRRH